MAKVVFRLRKPEPMIDTDDPYLTGQLLIAMPALRDPRFARTVIFMCAHNDEGAMGLVVNRLIGSISFDASWRARARSAAIPPGHAGLAGAAFTQAAPPKASPSRRGCTRVVEGATESEK